MTNEPFYSPNRKPAPARKAKPGEPLFEFSKGADLFTCELRDHGEFGVEAQFLRNGELYIARTLPSRELAFAWAEHERKHLERP